MKTKLKTKALSVLIGSAILFVCQANGQALHISPEWKAHFQRPPVIENCVYESKTFLRIHETSLFQFRYQENAFFFREICNLSDVSSNHIPTISFYAGRFESNCWSIQPTSDYQGKLVLFPNADNIWKTLPENGNETPVYASASMLSSLLYYGIGALDTVTVEWPEEAKFTAQDATGHKMVGEIIAVSQGRPTMLKWHYAPVPEKRFGFIVEYKYDSNLDLSYFPNEIRVSTGDNELIEIFQIIILQTSTIPLGREYYDPERYYMGPMDTMSNIPPRPVMIISNNKSYYVSGGQMLTTHPPKTMPQLGKNAAANGHPVMARLLFITLFILSLTGMLFAWKRRRNN